MQIIYLNKEELKPIVASWGGTLKFSQIVGVRERTVFRWLERGVNREPVAKLIRSLAAKEI